MRDRLKEAGGAEAELIAGRGGVFEITIDGELVFSKKQLHRFPTDEEVDSFFG